MMNLETQARTIIEVFVLAHGGSTSEIRREHNGFRWVALNGRTAWVGWL